MLVDTHWQGVYTLFTRSLRTTLKLFLAPQASGLNSVSFLSTAFVLFLLICFYKPEFAAHVAASSATSPKVRQSKRRRSTVASPSPSVPHNDTRPSPPFRSRALSFPGGHSLAVLMDHITESHSS